MVINRINGWLRKPVKPTTYKELAIIGSIYLTSMFLLRIYIFQPYYDWYKESRVIEALDKIIEENVIHAEDYKPLNHDLIQRLNITQQATVFGGSYNGSS